MSNDTNGLERQNSVNNVPNFEENTNNFFDIGEVDQNSRETQSRDRMIEQEMNHKLDKIIKDWYSSQDLLFCIRRILY